jgi:ADP-heptose:LPS heptosyltransferase
MHPRTQKPDDCVPIGGSVAVFRALPGLGDFLCAIPALRALRRARRDVEISLIGLPGTEALAARFDTYIDRFEPFAGFPGLPDRRPDVARIPGFLAAMQSRAFDLVIQLHGRGDLTNSIVALFGARRTAGFHPEGELPDPRLFDASLFLPWSESCSEIRQAMRLMAHLGWPSEDESLEFPVGAGAAAWHGGPYVVIHPGASVASRRWSVAGFAAVADAVAGAGFDVVISGSEGERGIADALARTMHVSSHNLAGRTTLDELAVFLRGASLLVCNDTGVSHLAAALRVPSVVVFRDSSVERWAPLDRRLHRPAAASTSLVVAESLDLLQEAHPHAA